MKLLNKAESLISSESDVTEIQKINLNEIRVYR